MAIVQRVGEMLSSGALGQLFRYGIAGAIAAGIYSAVYLVLADYALPKGCAVGAVAPAFLVAATCGFFLHSTWSFRGHAKLDPNGRHHLKFLTVQGAGLMTNAAFTWILTGPLNGPNWLPLIPSVLVTPLATFALYRQWVFR